MFVECIEPYEGYRIPLDLSNGKYALDDECRLKQSSLIEIVEGNSTEAVEKQSE